MSAEQFSGAAFLLAQLGAHAAARFDERVQALGLSSSHARILGVLTAHPGISQQELAGLLGMLPSRVVALVDEMEEARLLRRQRDDADRRRNVLVLTSNGTATLHNVAALARSCEDEICAVLTAAERRQLTRLLERMARTTLNGDVQ